MILFSIQYMVNQLSVLGTVQLMVKQTPGQLSGNYITLLLPLQPATTLYIGSKSGQCSGHCVGFIFTFILFIIPLTIRVRFPFFVIHSAFLCIPKIDDLFECFGKNNKKGCGCYCDCKCQQLLTKAFNKCCNRGSENIGLNEAQDDFSIEEVYGRDSDEEGANEIDQEEDPDHHSQHSKHKTSSIEKSK